MVYGPRSPGSFSTGRRRRISESRFGLPLTQRLEEYPVKVERRQLTRRNVTYKASHSRDPHISLSTPRVGKLLCALVTRVRNNGAHLNFITQREESAHTKTAALRTSNTHPSFIDPFKNSKIPESGPGINGFPNSPKIFNQNGTFLEYLLILKAP